jgi:hypothetical protein
MVSPIRLVITLISYWRVLRKKQPTVLDDFLLALAREGEDAFVVGLANLEREL